MAMTMMNIRKMGMLVRHHVMLVKVAVRFLAIPFRAVVVPVMLVVPMGMAMFQGFVGVLVFVPLQQVQPNT